MNDAVRTVTVTRAQDRFRSWAVDILIYTLVLNLFVEYSSAVVIDSFTISILTAAVLKVILDALTAVEHRVRSRLGRFSSVLSLLATWLVVFLSKFVILEIIDVIFGEHVELGGFILVAILVVTMMLVREVTVRVYRALGAGASDGSGAVGG